MKSMDFPKIKAIYDARAKVTTGLVKRTPNRWRMWRRMRHPATSWMVAEERGRIIGYAVGFMDEGYRDTGEVMWLPEYDGTTVGAEILDAMLKHLERTKADTIMIWGMEDSPTPLLPIPPDFERTEATGVFMAGVTDVRLLLRDARAILIKRVKGRLRLKVGTEHLVVGVKGAVVQVSMEGEVLLGLLLGIRNLNEEIRHGRVHYAPRGPKELVELQLAFPDKKFRIEDGW